MLESPPKYIASMTEEPLRLRRGEIISDVVQLRLALDSIDQESPHVDRVAHPFAIVLSQDCDLEQHIIRLEAGKSGNFPNVLLCEAESVETLRGTAGGSDIWKRIRQNKDERYQCLERVPAEQDAIGQGFDALGIDFKRFFTAPTDELLERIRRGEWKRRACLAPPYNLHLAFRFFSFQMRVALQDQHQIQ